jgi:hypothetical protein
MHLNFLTGEMFNSKQGVTAGHHGQSVYRRTLEARGAIFNLPTWKPQSTKWVTME